MGEVENKMTNRLEQQIEPVTQAFKREERFIVIKRKHLSSEAEYDIRAYLGDNDIATVECVVVESDWPEYETVWQMVEARCAGRTTPAPIEPVTQGEEHLDFDEMMATTRTTPAPSQHPSDATLWELNNLKDILADAQKFVGEATVQNKFTERLYSRITAALTQGKPDA